eukprot:CAMPEP_0114555770 /NCGR_PEP_ID=MMETSP0114-20121206/8930_1 /TAXON_ID=31324 /ORGANISM="Goniomonas sp, Strain m" /LENGTH=229 /DNA_ID=CAMNT_0001740925 /DNA_START=23 /DNA_END=712 /DNA_ORIENTATION=-
MSRNLLTPGVVVACLLIGTVDGFPYRPSASLTCSSYVDCETCVNSTDLVRYNGFSISFLHAFPEFKESATRAIEVLKEYKGVIHDMRNELHVTFQYFCCYSLKEYETIIQVLEKTPWEPVNISFSHVECWNGNKDWKDVFVVASPESQTALLRLVESFEQALMAAGVPVPRTRAQQLPFHSSLAYVAADFDVATAIPAVNEAVPNFTATPLQITGFDMLFPPHHFQAHG